MPRYTLGNAQIKILIVIGVCALAVVYAIFKGGNESEPTAPLVPVVTNPTQAPTAGKAPTLVPLTQSTPAAQQGDGSKTVTNEAGEQSEVVKSSPEQVTFERAAGVFEAEAIDPEWAPDYQQEISAMFTDADALSQVSVNSIECRSTMCRVLVFTPSEVEANQLNSAFYATIGGYKSGFFRNNNIMGLNNFANGVTALYIAKPGTELSLF